MVQHIPGHDRPYFAMPSQHMFPFFYTIEPGPVMKHSNRSCDVTFKPSYILTMKYPVDVNHKPSSSLKIAYG